MPAKLKPDPATGSATSELIRLTGSASVEQAEAPRVPNSAKPAAYSNPAGLALPAR